MSMDETMSFEVEREKNVKTKEILTKVYQALLWLVIYVGSPESI